MVVTELFSKVGQLLNLMLSGERCDDFFQVSVHDEIQFVCAGWIFFALKIKQTEGFLFLKDKKTLFPD